MISIIICSRKDQIPDSLVKNINDTIGIEYELVVINNSLSCYSIFEAYNLGISRSRFPVLCFTHEDVKFHTTNWGEKVVSHFYDSNLAMIGVAGSDCLLKIPGTYSTSGIIYWNLIQSNNSGSSSKRLTNNPDGKIIKQVYALDGFWFCIRKELFKTIKFDEESYSGFHFYDYDICMQIVREGYKIGVIYDILIEHFSYGIINREWLTNSQIFFSKWSASLPMGTENLDPLKYKRMVRSGLIEYITFLKMNHVSSKAIDKFIKENFASIFILFNKEYCLALIQFYLLGSRKFYTLTKNLPNLYNESSIHSLLK